VLSLLFSAHVVKLAGIDYVGIGSDFDGGGGLADCEDAAGFPKITRELMKRGYKKRLIIRPGNLFLNYLFFKNL
jgi:membrane dipeptidase